MKKLLMLVMAISTLMAQDIAGHYRVSALDVQYYDIARQDVDVNVQDAYGLGVELTLLTLHAGDLFYGTHSGPYNEAVLAAVGINLNVNFNEDGSATLAAGSYYPDVNEENCVSSVQILPITDDMVYSSDLTALSPVPSTNMVGLPSISARAGSYAGGLSLNEALVFDYFPQGAAGYINQYGPDFTPFTGDEVAPVTIPTQVTYPTGDVFPANTPLPGVHGGWVSVGNLGASQIPSSSIDPDLYAEWHAIDGTASESGLGDFIGEDEDGFDGDLDRTFGLPVLPTATYFTGNAGCNVAGAWAEDLGSTAVAGDVTSSLHAGVQGGCYASVIAGVAGQCEAVGGVANTVYGGCVEQAYGDDFAAGCAYYGVTAAVAGACEAAGGPATVEESIAMGLGGMTCTDIGASYDAACGGDCACASGAAATSCADSGGTSLCCLAGGIGEASSGGDCTAFASSFTNETLDGYAVALTGATCGQAADGWVANCIAAVDVATTMYVMDPSGNSAPWSNFVTWNGVAASQGIAGGIAGCMAQGLDYDTCYGMVMADPTIQYLLSTDDSGSEMDPSCLADGDFSDCSGRVRFNFAPTCIPEIEVRQVVIEAVLLGGECLANGDANEDGAVNVLDVVGMVQAILGNGTLSDDGACNADINADGTLNVLDVVSVVQSILGNRATSASAVEIIKSSEGVSFVADGYVGGIQMTINHGDDFSIEMTEKAMVADYRTEGNSTTLMVVNPESDELFVAEGNFTIGTVVAATNGEYIDISVPNAFSVSNAYPNPFNPTTSLDLVLDADTNVSVKVFNVMGQLVDVVTEGQMTQGTHAISWDASTVASGVYFINTEVGTTLNSQKVMLLK